MKSWKEPVARRHNQRSGRKAILIICEGDTERNYFTGFSLTNVKITDVPVGNSVTFVTKAVEKRDMFLEQGRLFDESWVVFDKDDNDDKTFNDAIKLAKENHFSVAYSNQAFEFWYLLHYIEHRGPMDRSLYDAKLTGYIGFKYEHANSVTSKMYKILLPHQKEALARANRVYNKIGNHSNPAKEESSTTVFQLVEELNKYNS